MNAGATAKNTNITTKLTRCSYASKVASRCGWAPWTAAFMSPLPEQALRPDHQDDSHHDEDHGVGSLGEVHLRETFDHAQREAGDDRSHDGAHAADHNHCEHDDDQVRAHERTDLVDRR